MSNFPNLLGAVDGKHVRIIPPPGSGSYFYNYKGEHSLVLMAVVNSNYEFIMADFGVNGRISDGGVIEYTKFFDKLKNGTLCLPPPRRLKNSNRSFPFVFVGDEAFALRPDFLKPFSQRELNHDKKIFNYRLSRARCRVENTFGIMSARFRIFHTAIGINLHAIETVVMACCVLHNFLRRKYASSYTPDNNCFDRDNIENGTTDLGLQCNMTNLQRSHNRQSNNTAKEVRLLFMDYFNQNGAVSWQERMIR